MKPNEKPDDSFGCVLPDGREAIIHYTRSFSQDGACDIDSFLAQVFESSKDPEGRMHSRWELEEMGIKTEELEEKCAEHALREKQSWNQDADNENHA